MKVQRFVYSALMLVAAFGSKRITAAAAVSATAASNKNNINRHIWPPMKHHDIWGDETTNTRKYEIEQDDESVVDIEGVVRSFDEDDFDFVANSFDGAKINQINKIDENIEKIESNWFNETINDAREFQRQSKVLHIFPVPVDGECLSDDGRRTGSCFNPYECRQKGGIAKGDCAMGFGVCCIFLVNCNETVSNNITYLVSPQFPSFMPNNFTSCTIKVKLMVEDISQLRLDFYHFSLGQPNRRTGVCDGDVFNITGGPSGTFSLCGQNSGQHIYYDVGGRVLPRQSLYGSLRPPTLAQIYPNLNTTSTGERLIEINMNFAQRFLPIRLWEIRIAQIPFSQRAPAGCLQYHSGAQGIIQTFNFADNGRHLANQHYRICMRQETEMCSIMYQPCDEQSFRIGSNMPFRETMEQPLMPGMIGMTGVMGMAGMTGMTGMFGNGGGGAGIPMGGVMNGGPGGAMNGGLPMMTMGVTPAGVMSPTMVPITPAMAAADDAAAAASMQMTSVTPAAPMASMASQSPSPSMADLSTTAMPAASSTTVASAASSSVASSAAPMMSTAASSTTLRTTQAPVMSSTVQADDPVSLAEAGPSTAATSTTPSTTSPLPTSQLSDDVEGSGDDSFPVTPGTEPVSRRPRPVSGGFDILGFLRTAFDIGLVRKRNARLQRRQRQIFSTCTDRITLPCIIEDFIGAGLGPLPNCEPVHCGSQFCSSGVWPCRIESTVTPFFLNIHFGDGAGKGSAEDNIGACLRYTQVQCL